MRIIIFNTLYFPYSVGGAEKSVQLLAEGLAKKGHDVTVATLHEGESVQEEIMNSVRILRFPLLNVYWPASHDQTLIKKICWHFKDNFNRSMLRSIADRLDCESFDIVHTNNLAGFSVSIWKWAHTKKIPIVHTTRDYYLFHPNTTLFKGGVIMSPNKINVLVFSKIKKIFSGYVGYIVGISDSIKELHLNNSFFSNSQSITIYNSVKVFKGKLGNAKNNPLQNLNIGFLGRIEEVKGIGFLLDSVINSNAAVKKYNFYIAGEGDDDYIKILKSKYSNLNLIFMGRVKIEEFFPLIDYLVVPSLWHEPMGRVVIEANSFGIPVIGSNRGGIKEIIKDDETGFVFDIDSQLSLSKVLNNLGSIDSEKFRLLKDTALLHSKKFNTEEMVLSYEKVYSMLMTNFNKKVGR